MKLPVDLPRSTVPQRAELQIPAAWLLAFSKTLLPLSHLLVGLEPQQSSTRTLAAWEYYPASLLHSPVILHL